MPAAGSVTVATETLTIGKIIQYPIHDLAGTLLFASGVLVTARIKEQLEARDIREVVLHPVDARDSTTHYSAVTQPATGAPQTARNIVQVTGEVADIKAKVDVLADTVSYTAVNTGASILETKLSPGCAAYDPEQRERLTQQFDSATSLINNVVASLLEGASGDAKGLAAVATNYVAELTQDSGHVVATSTELAQDPKVTERSVRMSVLGMAVAIELGFDVEQAQTVGVCGLIQDWGIFRLPERLRDPKEPPTPNDWAEIMCHPIHTADLLQQVTGISELSRVVCYQIHECYEGSGYPNGRQGEGIHLFARILGLADAYISLTSNIRGRPALVPYDAMATILHQSRQGRFDRNVVRALLHVLSMYPVGSHVQLSDGTEAVVLRASGSKFTRPIVRTVHGGADLRFDAAHATSIVDLSQVDTEVAQPLKSPGHKEMSIHRELMDGFVWDGPES